MMILKFLGWVWIFTGVFFILKPTWLKNRIKKNPFQKTKRMFFSLGLLVGVLLLIATWPVPGILSRAVFLCGLFSILKALFFLKSKFADEVLEWYLSRPVRVYRSLFAGQILFGAMLLSV